MTHPTDFFVASKLGWYIVAPSHLLVWLLLAAALLSLWNRRTGRILTAGCAGLFLLLLLVPVGNLALRPLEDRYPRPPWPERVDGILVLGEGLSGTIFKGRGVPGIGLQGGGLIAVQILAARYPDARIVFTGGSGELEGSPETEAQVAEAILQQMGIPSRRTLFEPNARNTWENIVFTRNLVQPGPDETWLLVASAFHMPRAIAVAKSLGWQLVPWPSGYLTTGTTANTPVSLGNNLAQLDLAAHEWLGLVVYRLSHKAA